MTATALIFVVEDEALSQIVVEDELLEGGFAVAMASSGEQAMSMLNEEGAHYRVLITDVNLLGKLTGWDVARRAREINDELPVIYMTGASAHDWASKGVPNSMLLTKPFAASEVVMAVSQLLNANPIGHVDASPSSETFDLRAKDNLGSGRNKRDGTMAGSNTNRKVW